MDDEGEIVVRAWTVGFYYLEGSEQVQEEGNGARGCKGVGKLKALCDGKQFCCNDGGSGWKPPGSGNEPLGDEDGCTDGWRVKEA